MAEDRTTALIESQQWLEPLADQVQQAVSNVFEEAGDVGQKVKNFLHGTWLGHPVHATLTDIPVGSWTAALVMDALEDITGREEFGRGADTAVAIGLAGAVASAVTGLTDWQATDGRARQIGIVHGLLNTTGALLYAGSLIARKKDSRPLGRGLSMLGFAVAVGAAYLGGKLVYSEQVGVDHTAGQHFPKDFQPVLAESDLQEGQMRRVDVEGTRVLLAKREGRVFAIAEVCSHYGGPLAEGKFEGCTVQCPWHGSRFSLEDGSVIDGPATHPQPCLEVRVSDGAIEVRG
jgi:nitrite reductase/ring-hydroxylating ferredoxin subunit/uncharacterized membrane protein